MRPFEKAEIERMGALAARGLTVAEIAAEMARPIPTVRWKCQTLGLSVRPAPGEPPVFTAARVERIRGMAGRVSAVEIAAAVGVSVASLKSWARGKVALALPTSKTICAQYNRLRQRAHQLGLRLSAQGGRVSLWVSVREDLTFAEAAQFLKHANRKARFVAVEAAFERGMAQASGNAAPPAALAKLKGRKSRKPCDIRILFQPPLRASVAVPEFKAHVSLPTAPVPRLGAAA